MKSARTAAKRIFNRYVKKINESIEANDPQQLIDARFDDLKKLWDDVQEKHESYIEALESSKSEYDADSEEQWIIELDEAYEGVIRKRFEYLKILNDVEKQEEENQLNIAQKKADELKDQENRKRTEQALRSRALEKVSFEQEGENLEKLICLEEKKPSPSVNGLEAARDDLKRQLEHCKKAHANYIMLLDAEKADEEIKWITKYQNIYAELSQRVGDIIHKKGHSEDTPKKKCSMKLENIKLPVFDGNIRDYPRFRSDFERHILPELESDERATYILKSCLRGKPLEEVCNVDTDIKEMWKRLDEKYGQPSKLADIVVLDIKNLKSVRDGDDEAFLDLVNTVEKGYYDLARIKMESEMSNNATVSLVEERLPRIIRREWSKEVNKSGSMVDPKDKFPHLLKFLQEQRKIIEYELSELRCGQKSRRGEAHMIDSEETVIEENPEEKVSRCLIHNSGTHSTDDCRVYQDKTPEEKVRLLKEKRGCWSCLKSGHRSIDCKARKRCNIEGCLKFHHQSLHLAHAQGIVFHTPAIAKKSSHQDTGELSTCLLQVMKISCLPNKDPVNVLWDGGATVSLITFSKAKELKLVGDPVKLSIVKVGGSKVEIHSSTYTLPLIDKSGNIIEFQVYGIDKISSYMHSINVDGVLHLFHGVKKAEVDRPVGEIDVLIGFEYAGFHPVRLQSSHHLLLLGNQFGRCLGGSHWKLRESAQTLIQYATVHLTARINVENFFDTEALGVECTPKCGSCKCGRCPIGGKSYTLKEERELRLIEEGLEHKGDHWIAKYPWIKDPKQLPNNKEFALRKLRATEKRLGKNEALLNMYAEQIEDMIGRGVARKLTQSELDKYAGPVHYLSHHEVLKPDSLSTPCRIVFNSSADYDGHSLNSYWAKGPDLMNSLLGITIRLREGPVAFAGDIRKMYHAIKISILDQHTHRFLWRDDKDKDPSTFVMTSVSFGDRPAGNIATVALRKTAEMMNMDKPDASRIILSNTYVDDIVDSVDCTNTAKKITGQIESVLKCGGFQVKHWVYTVKDETSAMFEELSDTSSATLTNTGPFARTSEEVIDDQKVLGLQWNPKEDCFHFKVTLNFSPRIRKIRNGPNLTPEQVPTLIPQVLTKRMVLSQINGIYDPLGLATPFTVRAKMLMRKLWLGGAKSLDWDDPMPEVMRDEWIQFFVELFEMEKVKFPRCIKPVDAVGDPILVMFSDGSDEAYGTCGYARWRLDNGTFGSILIAAKGRVNPIRKITIVRAELNGALMSKRLSAFIKKESRLKFQKEYFIVDSEIVRAMIQKESYGFNTYAAVRVGEIQEATDPSDWYWIEGQLNIADWTTRGKKPQDISEESKWQLGPEFLQLDESQWPIKASCSSVSLPELTKKLMYLESPWEVSSSKAIDATRFSCYYRLLRVTARILAIRKKNSKPSFKNIANPVNAQSLRNAENWWIKEAQKSLQKAFQDGKYLRICARRNDEGKIVVGGRALRAIESSYDEKELILLPHDHTISRLYAEKIHQRGHAGVSATMSKIRSRFWIPNLRKMVRSIKGRCITCKKAERCLEGQIMGPLPKERLSPAPAWSATAIDFFGPFMTRGETNKRSRGKAYGLLFNCLASRAVYVDIATDYSTEGFLMVLRRFISLRGFPKVLFSDCGSQLVAADKELKAVIKDLDQNQLREFGVENGLEWKFTAADAPWQNGCSEALVKLVKKAIKGAIGEQVLTFSELQTVCFEAANLVNERPIGIHPTDPSDGAYLSPNHLLLGRASTRVPSGPFKQTRDPRLRYEFIQKIVDAFWKRWTRDYFPSLLIRQKWHVERRNVRVGDIVMVQDSNAVRGNWKIGRITKTFPGEDSYVRKVELQYKNVSQDEKLTVYKGKAYVTVERPVQKLVVLLPIEELNKRE